MKPRLIASLAIGALVVLGTTGCSMISTQATTITYSANYDGTDYKFVGSPDADTITLKLLDANTTEATLKMVGKVMQTTKAVVSADGKTRTLTTSGVNAKGQKVNNVLVFDRQ